MSVVSARGRFLGVRTTKYRQYVNKETGEVKPARSTRHVLILDSTCDVLEAALDDGQSEPTAPFGADVTADVSVRSYQGRTFYDLVGLSPSPVAPVKP